MPVLKVGCQAKLDTFSGLIRCRVTAIRRSDYGATLVDVRLLEDKGPYSRGETFVAPSTRVIPTAAVRRRKYATMIGAYTVEV